MVAHPMSTLLGKGPQLRRGTADLVIARLFPKPNPYREDPALWVEHKLGGYLWSKQREIAQSVVENRYTAVQSCHGVGKSYDAAALVSWWLDVHPVGEAFVVTTAPTQPQVYAILWREIRRMHRQGGLGGRITLDANWYMGYDELVAYGRKPNDYDPAAFQGIHARYVLVVMDEACGVPKALWDAVDSLATNEDARVLAIGNPDDPNTQFREVCKPGSGWNNIRISAFDSPAFTGEEVPPGLLPLLVSKTWVEERKARWGVNSPLYQSKVLGEFPEISDDTLITAGMIARAWNTELAGIGTGNYGVDVARYGPDKTTIYRNRDGVVRHVNSWPKTSIPETYRYVADQLRRGPKRAHAVIDADGIGGGVYDLLAENDYNVTPFHGGGRSSDPARFENLRAEMYWELRQLMDEGALDLDPEDTDLAAQLGQIKFKVTKTGKIQIESKEEMRKRGIPSPDLADAVVMSLMRAHMPEILRTPKVTVRERGEDLQIDPDDLTMTDVLERDW